VIPAVATLVKRRLYFYKGQTYNFAQRMKQHNNGEVNSTAKYLPVEPIHWEIHKSREEAVTREKYLKRGKGRVATKTI